MTVAPLAGVRLAPGALLVWCACDLELSPGSIVVVELGDDTRVGRVVVSPDQLVNLGGVTPRGRVLRPASPAESADWERDRRRPTAGPALAREIEQIPPDAETA